MSSRRLLRRTPFAPPRAATRLHNRLRVRLNGRAVVAGGGRRRRLLLGGLLRERKGREQLRAHGTLAPTARALRPLAKQPLYCAEARRVVARRLAWPHGRVPGNGGASEKLRNAVAPPPLAPTGTHRLGCRLAHRETPSTNVHTLGEGSQLKGGPAIFSRRRERQRKTVGALTRQANLWCRHKAERARPSELNASNGAGERPSAQPRVTRVIV